MADAFRGLTIRLGADARPLNSAISSISRSAAAAQKQLNAMSKALKFDPGNMAAMAMRLDLAGDKAQHAARAVRQIRTAMDQVAPGVKKLADGTTEVYAKTERLRSEYNHVDAELQRVYDGVKRVYAQQNKLKIDSEEVTEYIAKLRRNYDNAGDSAKKLTAEMNALVKEATKKGLFESAFGRAREEGAKMVEVTRNLRARQKELNAEVSKFKAVEGYRAMRTQLIAWEAELKQASSDAARFRAEMHAISSMGGHYAAMKGLDAAIEKTASSAREMSAAFAAMPRSIDAAKAKAIAYKAEEEALNNKLRETRAVIDELGHDPAISRLEAETRDVWAAAERATNAYADMDAKIRKAKGVLEGMSAKMQEALFNPNSTMTYDELFKMRAQWDKIAAAVDRLKSKAASLDETMRGSQAAVVLREAREEVVRLTSALARLDAASSGLNRFKESFGTLRTMGYGLYSTITPAIMIAGRYAIQAADDIDSAYRDMRKTVNGTEQEFEHLKEAAIAFSTTHITGADTILEIEAMGGQLGIAAENLEAFATTVSNLDIATNMEADDISEQLGKMASVMGINVDEYDNFGDALVRLGNNMPVMESDIMTLTTRYMGMGKVVGMTADQMLAWSAAASATGQKSEAAGSAMQRFVSKVETAVVGGGEMLEKFASVAHMSADEFANAFKADASDAMYQFVRGLGEIQKSGGSVNQTLADLKINNVRDKQLLEGLAQQMANNSEEATVLYQALKMSSEAYNGLESVMADGSVEKAGDAAREAARKSEGFSGALGIMKNNAKALAMELADGALPFIQFLGSAFQELTAAVSAMPDATKSAIVGILGIAAAAGPALVSVGAIGSAITSFVEMAEKAAGAKIFRSVAEGLSGWRAALAGAAGSINPLAAGSARAAKALTGLQGAMTAVATASPLMLAAGAAVAALAVAWGVTLANAAEESRKKQELNTKATEGAREYVKGLASANEVLAGTYGALAKAESGHASKLEEMNEAHDEAIEKTASMVDSWKENEAAARDSASAARYWSEKIIELSGNCNGNKRKLEELRTAVQMYNELTGSSLSVTGEFSGAISQSTDELRANTEAFMANAYAKAYQADLEGATEDLKNWQSVYNDAQRTYTENIETYLQGMKLYADGFGNIDWEAATQDEEFSTAAANIARASSQIDEASQHIKDDQDAIAALRKAIEDMNGVAAGDEKLAARLRNDVNAYADALGGGVDGLNELHDAMEGVMEDMDQFAAALSDAGVEASDLGKIGADGFHNLLDAANGDIASVGVALGLLNAMQIDPKQIEVTDDGLIDKLTGKLWHLDAQAGILTDGEYYLRVTEDGITQAIVAAEEAEDVLNEMSDGDYEPEVSDASIVNGSEQAKRLFGILSEVAAVRANPSVSVTDNASDAIARIKAQLNELARRSVTVAVNAVLNSIGSGTKQAAGGINPGVLRTIPRYASGAALNGIVTRATLTNRGWVGEAGAEAVLHMRNAGGAVIPLSNRRYVRPFARAVASEIPSAGGSTTFNVTFNVDGGSDPEQFARQSMRAMSRLARSEGR